MFVLSLKKRNRGVALGAVLIHISERQTWLNNIYTTAWILLDYA